MGRILGPGSGWTPFLWMLTAPLVNAGAAPADVKVTQHRIRAGAGVVILNCYTPNDKDTHPAVVLLPGVGGQDPVLRKVGKALAEKGYIALVPNLAMAEDPSNVESSFGVVKRVLDFAATRPGADPDRLGIFGYSKGAYLAAYVGGRDPRVKAVVQCEGPAFPTVNMTAPAVFLIHADGGNTPAFMIEEYVDALKGKRAEVWTHVYPGIDHNLTDRHMIDAGRRSAVFFDEFLKEAKEAPEAGADARSPVGRDAAKDAKTGDAKAAAKPDAPKEKAARKVPKP